MIKIKLNTRCDFSPTLGSESASQAHHLVCNANNSTEPFKTNLIWILYKLLSFNIILSLGNLYIPVVNSSIQHCKFRSWFTWCLRSVP